MLRATGLVNWPCGITTPVPYAVFNLGLFVFPFHSPNQRLVRTVGAMIVLN